MTFQSPTERRADCNANKLPGQKAVLIKFQSPTERRADCNRPFSGSISHLPRVLGPFLGTVSHLGPLFPSFLPVSSFSQIVSSHILGPHLRKLAPSNLLFHASPASSCPVFRDFPPSFAPQSRHLACSHAISSPLTPVFTPVSCPFSPHNPPIFANAPGFRAENRFAKTPLRSIPPLPLAFYLSTRVASPPAWVFYPCVR